MEYSDRIYFTKIRLQYQNYYHLLQYLEGVVILTRKNLLVSLILLLLLVLTACSPDTEEIKKTATEISRESTSTPIAVEEFASTGEPARADHPETLLPCTISLWHSFNENEIRSLLDVADAYREIQPDVEFDFLYTPSYDLRNKFEEAAASGGGPSILIGTGEWGPTMFDKGLLRDISSLSDSQLLENINPAALGAFEYKGALIGLPLNLKGVLLFRNSDIIPDAPGSFDELISAAQSATEGDVVGAYLDYGLFYSAGHLHALGGALMDSAGNPAFNNEVGVQWMEMLKRFEQAGPIDINNDSDLNLFVENRVGMIIDVLSNTQILAEGIGQDKLEIDPWPSDMSGYVQSDGIFLNSNITGYDEECGWSFVEFLLSEESQVFFSNTSKAGFIPALLGIELSDLHQAQASDAFTEGTTYPVIPEMTAYWDPLNKALNDVVELGLEPRDALTSAEEAVIAAISQIRSEQD